MNRPLAALCMAALLSSCRVVPAANDTANDAGSNGSAPSAAPSAADLSLIRLDCGNIKIKNFDKFFSDKPGLYEAAPRDIVASCYLIKHGDRWMIWDTGLTGELKGREFDTPDNVLSLKTTIAEQLAPLKLKPSDISIVGISHHHDDHTGQLAQFANARLIIGAGDFDKAQTPPPQGGPPTITSWLKPGANVTKVTADVDVFGDGSVIAMHLPGHTPDHMALLVNLKSGPVLLSGDLYHSLDAREKRGVPPFNVDRAKTLASMDKFEAKAKETGAKVIIQHEPRDISKLPAFPAAAQ